MRVEDIEKFILHLDKLEYFIRVLLKDESIPADIRGEMEAGLIRSEVIRRYLEVLKKMI